jgi:hypothetical protein
MSSTVSVIDILQRFKSAYMDFIDELLEQFPNESDLIIIRVFFEDQVPVTIVADSFVDRVLPYQDMIKRRDDTFFMKNNHMFDMLDTGKVMHFKTLWTSDKLDKDDRDVIWKWFDTFCILVDAYRKNK